MSAPEGDQSTPAVGELNLHVQGNALVSWVTPKLFIDGYPVPVKYGENRVPVVEGSHVVHGHTNWMWQYGNADLPVQVTRGQSTDVWYAAPLLTFMKGAIGPTKQRAPGLAALLAVCGGLVVLVVLVILVAALGS